MNFRYFASLKMTFPQFKVCHLDNVNLSNFSLASPHNKENKRRLLCDVKSELMVDPFFQFDVSITCVGTSSQ